MTQVDDDSLDAYVQQAFEALSNDPSSDHPNLLWIPPFAMFSCKTEAQRLLMAARMYRHMANAGGSAGPNSGTRTPQATTTDTIYDSIGREGSALEALTDEAERLRP